MDNPKDVQGLVPLEKRSLMYFLQNTVDDEDANYIKEGIWDGEYLADEIISKFGVPSVPSVEEMADIIFKERTGHTISEIKKYYKPPRDFNVCDCGYDGHCNKCEYDECFNAATAIHRLLTKGRG